MAICRKKLRNEWYKHGEHYTYLFEKPQNVQENLDYKRCMVQWNIENHTTTLNYYTEGWLSIWRAEVQMQNKLRSIVHCPKCLVSVENQGRSKRYGETARVTCTWLSKDIPTVDKVKEIEEILIHLPETAPVTASDLSKYLLDVSGLTDEDEKEMADTDYIRNAEKCGFF